MIPMVDVIVVVERIAEIGLCTLAGMGSTYIPIIRGGGGGGRRRGGLGRDKLGVLEERDRQEEEGDTRSDLDHDDSRQKTGLIVSGVKETETEVETEAEEIDRLQVFAVVNL